MQLKRLIALAVVALFIAPISACSSSKPSKSECRDAINNIRKIRNTANDSTTADPRRAIRSCQGNSSKKTVKCFIAAKTEEDLAKCEGETGSKYLEEERKAREEAEKKAKEEDDKKKKDGE